MDIRGKVVLVTGAAGGIGRASAIAFAEHGAEVVFLADVDVAGLGDTAQLVKDAGSRAEVVETDVADVAAQRALYARIAAGAGGLDVLHNNAGLATGMPVFPEMPLERIAALADVNLKGVLLGTRLAVDLMGGRGGAAIVNTASIAAEIISTGEAIYGTTKAAVVHFTRCCAAELPASHNIRVNCVCPGIVDTPMLAKTGDGTRPAAWLEPFLSSIKLLAPEEIAAAVIGLVEDDTKNGEVVTVMNEMAAAS